MGNIFSGSEIVEIGIQIEKNGRDFYSVMAEQSKNQKSKDIFKYLEGEEEKHIGAFEKVLDTVQKYEPPEAYPGEYFAYMNALASSYVFTQKDKGAEIAKKMNNDKEAIDCAIRAEKDSIIFYEGMKKVVPGNEHKVIDELITQEQDHLAQLFEISKICGCGCGK